MLPFQRVTLNYPLPSAGHIMFSLYKDYCIFIAHHHRVCKGGMSMAFSSPGGHFVHSLGKDAVPENKQHPSGSQSMAVLLHHDWIGIKVLRSL